VCASDHFYQHPSSPTPSAPICTILERADAYDYYFALTEAGDRGDRLQIKEEVGSRKRF
jgi:hypothetical protein